MSLLFNAIESGDLSKVNQALGIKPGVIASNTIDLSSYTVDGITVFMKILITLDEKSDDASSSAEYYKVWADFLAILDHLLDVNSNKDLLRVQSTNETFYGSVFEVAIGMRVPQLVKLLIDHEPSLVRDRFVDGELPLHRAIPCYFPLDVIKLFVEKDEKILDTIAEVNDDWYYARKPLITFFITESYDKEVFDLFLELVLQIDLNALNPDKSYTPLGCACFKACDIEEYDGKHDSKYHAIARDLLRNGASIEHATNVDMRFGGREQDLAKRLQLELSPSKKHAKAFSW